MYDKIHYKFLKKLKKKKKTITIMFKELEATENFYKEPANY